MSQKLGILLSTGPQSEDVHTAIRLAEAALHQGKEVRIFLMCDGVYHVHREDLMALETKGAELCLCAHNAQERGVEKREGIIWGSQMDLANLTLECDRFVGFT